MMDANVWCAVSSAVDVPPAQTPRAWAWTRWAHATRGCGRRSKGFDSRGLRGRVLGGSGLRIGLFRTLILCWSCAAGLFLLLLFVGFRAVIRDVEAAPLEDDPRAGSDDPPHLASALRAAALGGIGHLLEELE